MKKSATETFNLLHEAFGGEVISPDSVFRLHKSFTEGKQVVEDEQRAGRPYTSRTELLVNIASVIVRDDHLISVRYLAVMLNVSHDSAQAIFTEDLRMKLISCRWVPRLLLSEQMEYGTFVCQEL